MDIDVDTKELKRLIAEKNTTLEGVASHLGMDRSTLYRKLRDGGGGITLRDAQRTASLLGLSYEETIRIFWNRRDSPVRRDKPAKNMLSSPF